MTRPDHMRRKPPARGAPWAVVLAAAVGLAIAALGAALPTEQWVALFEHPVRTARHGGVVAATCVEGARWWRIALVAFGALLPVLVGVITRLAPLAESETAAPPPGRRGRTAAALVAIVLLGLALRLPRVGESFWYDELADFLAFGVFGPGPTMGNYFTPSNHILHGILAWLSAECFGGANELVLRLPALAASLAAIPACWFLGREAVAGAATRPGAGAVPWIAALLAACAPVAVLEAAEARGYSLMILASALATALFLRASRRPGTLLWVAYALTVALGTWAHLLTASVAVGHALLLGADLRLPERRRGAGAGLVAIALAACLTLLLYAPVLPDMVALRSQFRALDGDEPALLGPEGIHALLQLGGAWAWWAALPGLVLGVVGALSAWRDAGLRRALFAALLGGAAAVVLAAAAGSWLYARFLLFTLPGALLLIAVGLAALAGRGPRAIAVAALAVLAAAWGADLFLRPPKQPLREAVFAAVDAGAGTGPHGVAAIGLADNVVDWYGRLRGIEIAPTGPLGRDLAAVDDALRPEWIVMLYPRSVPAATRDELARRGFVLERRFPGWCDWDNGDVLLYRRGKER